MKRWLSIRIRQWGGSYTSAYAEEWEDWTCQWKAYHEGGDPINQMVRGTWQPNRSDSSRDGTWTSGTGGQTTSGTWHRDSGGDAAHGTWEEDPDDS
jgi:hypothetical protein